MDPFSLEIKKLEHPEEIRTYLTGRDDDAFPVQKTVEKIIRSIKNGGDSALIRFIRKYDRYDARPENIRVRKDEIEAAQIEVEKNLPELTRALQISRKNIGDYHRSQLENGVRSWTAEQGPGRKTGQKVTPLERAGLYIPGGRYAYPSTLLMAAIPAMTAGVGELAVCSPPGRNGSLNDVLLYLCAELRTDELYRMGGAQALAAMAFGTSSIKRVEKIVGPGNIYVTLAKKMVFGTVGIDSLAGPSDVTIISDEGARPELIALDMLSQSEHDPLSRSILLSSSRDIALRSAKNIGDILDSIKGDPMYRDNLEIMLSSVGRNCSIFYNEEMDALIKAANIIAPEHLEIMVDDPRYVLDRIKNAGAIFVGDYTPVAVGDYMGGTNHVIPTGGNARFASPLGVEDFLKRSSICQYTREALEAEKEHIVRLAGFEGLHVHGDSVRKRF